MLLVYFKKSFFVRWAVFLGCLCTALAMHHDVHSQDSLETKLRTARDAEKLALLEQLYRNYQASDFNKAIQFADAGISIANKLDDIRYVVVFNKYKASSLMDLGRNEEAVDILLPALKLARDNSISDQEMFILNNIGLAYTYRGIYDSALSFHFKSLELREKSGRKASMFNALNNIGLVYYKLKNPKLALNFYQRALDIKTELNDNTGVYALQVNIGLCYVFLNEYDNAISVINRALQSCGPSSSCDGKVLVDAYHAIGVAYLGIDDLAKSETFLLKSYYLSQERNDTRYMIENLEALASVDFGNKQFEAAIKKLQQAEVLATNTDFVENRITIYEKLAEEYKRIPDYQKATIYQDRYIKLKDSVYNDKLISNLAVVQTNYAERVNLKTISEQNDIIALKDQVLGKQRTITVLAMVIALLLLGFTYFAIQSGRTYSAKLKRHNEELEQKVLERTKELQKSNEKLLKAQHDLNNFLYKTSHDIRGPVATLKGLYNLITTKQNEPEELKDLIVREGVQIEKIYKILNRISMVTSIQNTFLKPEVIDFHALLNDIVDFERKNGQLKHIRVLVDVEPGLKMISDPYLIHLILENMVDNSLKFFNESTRIDPYVKITVSTSGSDALIKVEDNGVGIIMKPGQDVFTMFLRGSERSDIGGVGLYLCKVIADKLEGTIKLEKTSKEGTTFSLKLTLDATEQIKAWNTYLESEYRQEAERQVEYEKREQDAEQGGKASNPFIAT